MLVFVYETNSLFFLCYDTVFTAVSE